MSEERPERAVRGMMEGEPAAAAGAGAASVGELGQRGASGGLQDVKKRLWGSMFEGTEERIPSERVVEGAWNHQRGGIKGDAGAVSITKPSFRGWQR